MCPVKAADAEMRDADLHTVAVIAWRRDRQLPQGGAVQPNHGVDATGGDAAAALLQVCLRTTYVETMGAQARVKLTNADKVLYPATGTTKVDVFDYYTRITEVMLPHIAGRPATRKRWPNGV